MNRVELLLHELEITYEREGWFPPLKDALAGVTAEQASWRASGVAANTIWETLNHLLYYKERILARLRGEDMPYTAEDNDATFVQTGDANDEKAWLAAVKRAEEVHRGFYEYLKGRQEEDFDVLMRNEPIGLTLTSIILHDAYHIGQIIQIRKLQGSWPANRSFS